MKFVELLDEALERAAVAIDEKNPDLTADERAAVGAHDRHRRGEVRRPVDRSDQGLRVRLGPDAVVRRQHRPVPAVRARADLLDLPAPGIERASVRGADIQVGTPQERELALRLLAYPTAIDTTLETYSPHKLCTYVYDLATDFTVFYEHCPVLKADEPLRSSRLALADLTARTLQHALGLLGIDAPEQM